MRFSKNKFNIKKNYPNYMQSKRQQPPLTNKESNYYSKISDIYKFIYEDYFPAILTYKTKELFFNEIEKKALIVLHNNFSDQELQTSFIKISIKKIKEELINKVNKEYIFLQDSLNNIKKNQKKPTFLTHFRKHCNKTEDIAIHLCDNYKVGDFIEIKSKFYLKKNDISYVICNNCNYCYEKNFIKMFCRYCDKNYYSEILKENEDVNCLPATWENYHCGSRKKEIMKCLKCKNILYINLKNNKLICLNKNCSFCVRPENIIWECYLCNHEFKSGAKIYNPLELDIIKKIINRAILYRIKAVPPSLPCCNGKITDKTIFYHKKDCKGELFKEHLNYKEIVVCGKCQALNNYDKFSWLCPLCGEHFKINERNKSIDFSFNSIFSKNRHQSMVGSNNSQNDIHSNSNHYIWNLKGVINSNPISSKYKNIKEKNIQNNRNYNNNENLLTADNSIPSPFLNNYLNGYNVKKK